MLIDITVQPSFQSSSKAIPAKVNAKKKTNMSVTVVKIGSGANAGSTFIITFQGLITHNAYFRKGIELGILIRTAA